MSCAEQAFHETFIQGIRAKVTHVPAGRHHAIDGVYLLLAEITHGLWPSEA
jgi:hypothetical protein